MTELEQARNIIELQRAQLDELKAQIAVLMRDLVNYPQSPWACGEAALRKYGGHTDDCQSPTTNCTCGLSSLLEDLDTSSRNVL